MSKLARDANSAPIQVLRPITVTRIPVSDTAAGTAGMPEGVRVVRVVSPVDCFYSVTGAATTSSTYLPANAAATSIKSPSVTKLILAIAATELIESQLVMIDI